MRKRSFGYRLAVACLGILIAVIAMQPSHAEQSAHHSVKNDNMEIALTFDDGPHPTQTKRILEILARYEVKATFFMVGVNVENYPDAARAVLAAGHEVGNHTYTHRVLGGLSHEEIDEEIGRCEEAFEALCEYRSHLFRPPQGSVSPTVEADADQNDYSLILWSLDTRDWEDKNANRITSKVLSSVRSGDIILMHDYIGHGSQTPEALEKLLPVLLERGFKPVTVSELIDRHKET